MPPIDAPIRIAVKNSYFKTEMSPSHIPESIQSHVSVTPAHMEQICKDNFLLIIHTKIVRTRIDIIAIIISDEEN